MHTAEICIKGLQTSKLKEEVLKVQDLGVEVELLKKPCNSMVCHSFHTPMKVPLSKRL